MTYKNKTKSPKGEIGAGMADIVIVIAVSLILSAIAIPNIGGTLALRHLNAAVTMVSGKIMQARMTAIKRNKTAWVRINPTNRTVNIQTTDSAGNTIDLTPATQFSNQVSVSSASNIDISFDSMGRPTTAGQTITFEATGERTKNLSVSTAGKVTIGNTQ